MKISTTRTNPKSVYKHSGKTSLQGAIGTSMGAMVICGRTKAQRKSPVLQRSPKSVYKRNLVATRLDGKGLALWKKYVALSLKIREIEVAELLKDSVRLSNELAKINRHEKINILLAAGKDGGEECLGDYLAEGFLGESVESIGEGMGSRESFWGEEYG